MELMTPDLMCPSTHQLLHSFSYGSRPDVSFDKSASPEHFFGFAPGTLLTAFPVLLLLVSSTDGLVLIPIDTS
ncbi:hypothetical protein Tco_0362187 [Tanacetum coccineum]